MSSFEQGASRTVADEAAKTREELGAKIGKAADATRAIKDDTAELAGIASDLAGTAFRQSRALLDVAKGQATSFADDRKNEVAQSISDIASSLRETTKGFEGRPNITAFIGGAAEGLDQLSGTIRERSFAELYGEAESFARRQPAAVALATVAAGFLLARFIKSSAQDLSDANAARAADPQRVSL